MNSKTIYSLLLSHGMILLLLNSCQTGDKRADAYGNFESDEITISSEVNGKLLIFTIKEGAHVSRNETVGLVDTLQLYLQKRSLQASIQALKSKTTDVQSELDVWEGKKKNLEREHKRAKNLLENDAATQQQVDDLRGELEVVNRQSRATEIRLKKSNAGILSEIKPLEWRIRQIEDQILKSKLINPVEGTVLAKYVEQNEVVNFGRPLYKIADMDRVYLRAYLSETQLHAVKLGQRVKVAIDAGDEMKEFPGTVTWISEVAEFTPKVIQTKEERVNLVYAMKIFVENDGSIKLGMPGEVWIDK